MKTFLRARRRMIAALLAILLILLTAAAFWYARESRLSRATIRQLNDAQTIWYPNPILNYHIVVDVRRPGELRRTELTVENGEIVSATVKFWRETGWGWQDAYALNEDQAYPFTIPGLYDMLRGALIASNREEIDVDMRGDPPFPYRIVFGPVWEDGRPVWGTESQVTVRAFEVIPGE